MAQFKDEHQKLQTYLSSIFLTSLWVSSNCLLKGGGSLDTVGGSNGPTPGGGGWAAATCDVSIGDAPKI